MRSEAREVAQARLQRAETELRRREDALAERIHKFECDYAIVEAKKRMIVPAEPVDLRFDSDTSPDQLRTRIRQKEDELTQRKQLLDDKEHYLVELQKNILRRETELLHEKAGADAASSSLQTKQAEKQLDLDETRRRLKDKSAVLSEKEGNLLERESDLNTKLRELAAIKEDLNAKSI